MKTSKRSANIKSSKESDQKKFSSGYMKFFYLLMLLLIASSSILSFAGRKRQTPQATNTPITVQVPVSGGGTAARTLVFHQDDSGKGLCVDLKITAAGDAVYSDCGQGTEKQYVLSEAERIRLLGWVGQFKPINYNHNGKSQNGTLAIQLYLNGQGSKESTGAETQQVVDFARAVIAKIVTQS